jgi:hypothetical protein
MALVQGALQIVDGHLKGKSMMSFQALSVPFLFGESFRLRNEFARMGFAGVHYDEADVVSECFAANGLMQRSNVWCGRNSGEHSSINALQLVDVLK